MSDYIRCNRGSPRPEKVTWGRHRVKAFMSKAIAVKQPKGSQARKLYAQLAQHHAKRQREWARSHRANDKAIWSSLQVKAASRRLRPSHKARMGMQHKPGAYRQAKTKADIQVRAYRPKGRHDKRDPKTGRYCT